MRKHKKDSELKIQNLFCGERQINNYLQPLP